MRDPKQSDPVELDSEIIDAASITSENRDGKSPLDWEYTGEFEHTTSESDSFEAGFSQSITNTLTIGNDATAVKNELALTLGFDQRTTSGSDEGDRVNRTFTFSGSTPAGDDEEMTAWRKVARMRSQITGHGDYEHSIKIGKHWHGKWDGKTAEWETFADFLRVVKGEAPPNFDLADSFASARRRRGSSVRWRRRSTCRTIRPLSSTRRPRSGCARPRPTAPPASSPLRRWRVAATLGAGRKEAT